MDGNLLLNTSLVFKEIDLKMAKLTEDREIFDRKSQINVCDYTKSVDRNVVFNEIGLKMLENVSRFHICEYFNAKFAEDREIFKRKFQNTKTMDGNLLLKTPIVFNEIG